MSEDRFDEEPKDEDVEAHRHKALTDEPGSDESDEVEAHRHKALTDEGDDFELHRHKA